MITVHGGPAAGSAAGEQVTLRTRYELGALMDRALRQGGDLLVRVPPEAEADLARDAARFAAFLNFFRRAIGELSAAMEACNARLSEAPEAHVRFNLSEFARMNAGGKTIRGALAKLGYALFAGDETEAGNGLALAFELFQTAILIHDDFIDRATLRRNKPTIPCGYLARWESAGRPLDGDEARHTANSLALCAGDAGFFLAHQLLAESYREDPRFPALAQYYNAMALKTVQGEIIDVAMPFEEKYGISRETDRYRAVIEIYRLKTAWYTVVGPLCAGALLAGCGDENLHRLEAFCENLGIAFQIKDDIMGLFGEAATLGKAVGSDATEFKQTLFYSYMCQDEERYRQLLRYYGKPLSVPDLLALRELLQSSGALAYVEGEMERYYAEARRLLDEIDFLPPEKKDLLYGLVLFLRYRNK